MLTHGNQRGYSMHLVGISQYRWRKVRHAKADSPWSVPFKFNHLIRTLDYLLMQLAPIFFIFVGSHIFVQIAQTYSGNINSRPDGHWINRIKFYNYNRHKKNKHTSTLTIIIDVTYIFLLRWKSLYYLYLFCDVAQPLINSYIFYLIAENLLLQALFTYR